MVVEPVALPMREAQAFWADKKIVTRKEFDALSERARARAFTVTGLSAQDQLADVHAAMARAMEGGETLADFQGRIADIIEQQGWTGQRAWRVDNIFRTNLQSAYQAGRYVQMQRAAKTRPYWRYVAVQDSRTRPSHSALHGLVYPADHDFWSRFYPPNGFRCRCSVQTLSAKQVEERGYEVQKDWSGIIEPVDPRTGERLPPVRPAPDKGFAQNTAEDWLADLSPEEIDERDLRVRPTRATCRDGKGMFAGGGCKEPLARLDPRHILPVRPEDLLPAGLRDDEYVLEFLREFGMRRMGESRTHVLPGGVPVVISKRLFEDRLSGGWKVQKSGRERYLKLLARTILKPFEVWQVPAELAGRRYEVIRVLRLFQGETGQVGGFAVFNLVGRRWLGTTAFTPKAGRPEAMLEYLEKQRSGILLHREEL